MATQQKITKRIAKIANLIALITLIATPVFAGNKGTPAPAQLNATPVSDTEILLNWQQNSDNPAGFEVRRATSNAGLRSEESIIAIVAGDVRTIVDDSLKPTTRYYYAIRAFNGSTYSVQSVSDKSMKFSGSKKKTTTTLTQTPAITPPTELTTKTLSAGEIELSWKNNAADAAGYAVERAIVPDGVWVEVTQLNASATGYVDRGLLADSNYRYRVRAY